MERRGGNRGRRRTRAGEERGGNGELGGRKKLQEPKVGRGGGRANCGRRVD